MEPDKHLAEEDRSFAVAGLLLRGVFGTPPTGDDFTQRVANAVEEVRAARQKQCGSNPVLIVVSEGEVQKFEPSNERDADEFVVCFGGADKDAIRGEWDGRITALLNAMVCESTSIVAMEKKRADSVVFFREDGKPVYSYTVSGGAANVYVSKRLPDELVSGIGDLYQSFVAKPELQRVQGLIQSSFQTDGDPLRSFLAAWTAFEIFVNKVFGDYEKAFFQELLQEGQPQSLAKYLTRIQDVMKDKYRLIDKFAAISFRLAPEVSDADLAKVHQVKKMRDDLSHGNPIDEQSLPTAEIREIALRYVRLHAGG